MKLEWDAQKARVNVTKHGVTFEEAAEALNDRLGVVWRDAEHSIAEERFILTGQSAWEKVLTVSFTVREDYARIISARRSTRMERRRYMNDEETIHDAPCEEDSMLAEYGHLEGWERNPFRFVIEGTVQLDPDVLRVFETSEAVNDALRGLIAEGRIPVLVRQRG